MPAEHKQEQNKEQGMPSLKSHSVHRPVAQLPERRAQRPERSVQEAPQQPGDTGEKKVSAEPEQKRGRRGRDVSEDDDGAPSDAVRSDAPQIGGHELGEGEARRLRKRISI